MKLEDGYGIDFEKFSDMIDEVKPLIKRAFTSDFVIPDFKSFCATITEVRQLPEGDCLPETYIQVVN